MARGLLNRPPGRGPAESSKVENSDKGDNMNRMTPATKVLRKAQDLYVNSRELAGNGASHAKSFIHQRPLLSTLLGLGLGVLIGHWLRPRE